MEVIDLCDEDLATELKEENDTTMRDEEEEYIPGSDSEELETNTRVRGGRKARPVTRNKKKITTQSSPRSSKRKRNSSDVKSTSKAQKRKTIDPPNVSQVKINSPSSNTGKNHQSSPKSQHTDIQQVTPSKSLTNNATVLSSSSSILTVNKNLLQNQIASLKLRISKSRVLVKQYHQLFTSATNDLRQLEEELAKKETEAQQANDAVFDWLAPHPWDSILAQELKNTFRISTFRPLQREALNATLMNRDVFAILPTGAGKSLIYQLAAVVDRGLTLVVTPLISLSQDQRAALNRLKIQAESLDSTTSKEDVQRIYKSILPTGGKVQGSSAPRRKNSRQTASSSQTRRNSSQQWIRDDMDPVILFVTPEQVAKSKRLMSRLENMYEAGHLSRITIDEAHCCSTWGHDFRSEYRKLGILRRQCPKTPILALSATANPDTVNEVQKILETNNCVVFRGSVNRENLYYEVRPKKDDEDEVVQDIAEIIHKEFTSECGIIYVLSRRETETYAQKLVEHGINANCYHGDMTAEMRLFVHEQWTQGLCQVVVATIAFGMGIDNQNVRFVIHATMASSLEGYYQESGRAGRDGNPARCIVLHRAKEFAKLSSFVAEKGEIRLRKMYEMYRYSSGRVGRDGMASCRRAIIANAFGENPPEPPARCCDLCTQRKMKKSKKKPDDIVRVDVTNLARDAIGIMKHIVEKRPDHKLTLINFATDWSNGGAKGKQMRGEVKTIDRRIPLEARLELLVELILDEVFEEYHRFSSYAINSYVKEGPKLTNVLTSKSWRCIVSVWRNGGDALVAYGKGKLVDERGATQTPVNTGRTGVALEEDIEEEEEEIMDEEIEIEHGEQVEQKEKSRRTRSSNSQVKKKKPVQEAVTEEILDEHDMFEDWLDNQIHGKKCEESNEELVEKKKQHSEEEYSEEEELDGEDGGGADEEELYEEEVMEEGSALNR